MLSNDDDVLKTDRSVSVIIPVYNTAEYLRECLESLRNQSLPNMEILCVDDMSTDGSRQIMEEYAEKNPSFHVLSTGRNRGQAYARNLGLEQAAGKYVYFLDSDDLLSGPDSLARLYEKAEETGADCICFDSRVIYETERLARMEGGREKLSLSERLEAGSYTGEEYFCRFFSEGEYAVAVWRQFWTRNFLADCQLRFQENTSPHEDLLFTFQTFLAARRIFYYPELLHIYRYREGSSMTSAFSAKRYCAYGRIYDSALRYAESRALSPATENAVFRCLADIRQILEKQYASLIRAGTDLNTLPAETPAEALRFRLLTLELYPYLDRLITPDEYNLLCSCDPVIIYGAGKVGGDVRRLLETFQITKYFTAVTAPDAEMARNGIYPIEKLAEYRESAVVILAVTHRLQKEMGENLKRLGFRRILSLNGGYGKQVAT